MGLDDLISILALLFFVVVPILSRLGRRGQGQRRAGPPQTPPRGRTAPPPGSGADPGDVRADTAPDDALTRRLEEARRRVREALEGQAESSPSSRSEGTRTEAPRSDPARDPREAMREVFEPSRRDPPPVATFLGREGPPPRIERRSDGQRVTRPVATRRPSDRDRARLSPDRFLRFDPDDIVAGIIWHQILSEPVAKRRRHLSRPRSR